MAGYPGQRFKVDGWIEERTLGSGGFGTVTLWRNEETGDLIAIKRCTMHGDMKAQLKSRWKLECDIMLRLEHENVIKAYNVPKALDTTIRDSDLPLLAMEYCEGGDLRKVLNKPENCVGLSERQVRNIIQDVAAAIEYLHSKRIIHRDLKPENIVISTIDEKLVYKLIDLGYAKDLDQGSVCTSFVGTMQYLAPELFMSQKYTCTVDYWSFGTLAFECCVGFRPFFHSVPPIKWQNDVANKNKDDIHAFILEGQPCFSKSLPTPNYICRTFKFYFEQWLRFMLLWDPKERGGGLMDNGRPKCFSLLDNILKTKLLQVLIITRNEMLTYPISESKVLLKDMMVIIERETGIPTDQQELLLASGTIVEADQPAVMCLPDMPERENEDEWIVFLLDKREIGFSTGVRKMINMPTKVNAMVTDPKTLTMYQEQKVVWAHSFYFCRQVRKEYDRMIAAQRALMLCLLRYHSNFSKLQAELKTDIGSLQSKIELFKACHDYDLSLYKNQSQTGISSQKMFNNWSEIGNQVGKFESLQIDVERLETSCALINQMVMELNRSPYVRSKQESSLKDVEEKVLELYTKLRHTPVEQRNRNVGNNMPMVSLIVKVQNLRSRLTEDLFVHMSKVVQCKRELLTVLPKIQLTIKTINEAGKRLLQYQLQRQKDMWQLVSVALKQSKILSQKQKSQEKKAERQQSDDHSMKSSGQYFALDETRSPGMVGRSISKSSIGSASSVSQSSLILDKYTENSMNVLSDNHNTRNRLETMLLSFHEENIQKQFSSLEWDFLGTNPVGNQEKPKNHTVPFARTSSAIKTPTASSTSIFHHSPDSQRSNTEIKSKQLQTGTQYGFPT